MKKALKIHFSVNISG